MNRHGGMMLWGIIIILVVVIALSFTFVMLREDASETITPEQTTEEAEEEVEQPATEENLQSPEVINVEHYGSTEIDDRGIINRDEDCFKLSPFFEQIKTKEIAIDGSAIVITAIEAHEDDESYDKEVCTKDGSYCDTPNSWMVVNINNEAVEIAREQIKLINFDNGLSVYFAALDIEGEGSSAGSDLCIAKQL